MLRFCRFCKSWKNEDQMVKYGVRHYAHFECYLDVGKSLEDLNDWQILKFPWRLLNERGFKHVADAAYAREKAPA